MYQWLKRMEAHLIAYKEMSNEEKKHYKKGGITVEDFPQLRPLIDALNNQFSKKSSRTPMQASGRKPSWTPMQAPARP